jgi:hypothetical protein
MCLFACVGCSAANYFFTTGGIVNTGLIAAAVAGAVAIPNLLGSLRGLIPGL